MNIQTNANSYSARTRAVVYSTLSADTIMTAVAQPYGLDGSANCTLFHRGTNDIYQISTGTRQYALKLYRKGWRDREEILGELSAVRHVARKGVSVALPVCRSDGGFITRISAPEGPRQAVLYDWATGRIPRYTNANHTFSYGSMLAKLHLAAADLPTERPRRRFDCAQLLELPARRISERLTDMPSATKRFDALVNRMRQRLNSAEAQLDDWGFCHGDVWAGNARIDGCQIVLLDFDFCGWGWRVGDLASFRRQALEQGLEDEAWEPFIAGYLETRPDAAESLKFVRLFMILRHFWIVSQLIALSGEMGVAFHSDGESLEEQVIPFCEQIESAVT